MPTAALSRALPTEADEAEGVAPRPGDIVIAPTAGRARHYTMAQHPSGPQLRWTTREAAFALAGRFARLQAVDVWMLQASGWARLASHRPQASTSSPVVG